MVKNYQVCLTHSRQRSIPRIFLPLIYRMVVIIKYKVDEDVLKVCHKTKTVMAIVY